MEADSIPESDDARRSVFAERHSSLLSQLQANPNWTPEHEAELEELVAWVEREGVPVPAAIQVYKATGEPGQRLLEPLWGGISTHKEFPRSVPIGLTEEEFEVVRKDPRFVPNKVPRVLDIARRRRRQGLR